MATRTHETTVRWVAPETAELTCTCGALKTERVLRNEFQWFRIAADLLRTQHDRESHAALMAS